MAVMPSSNQQDPSPSYIQTVDEIMKIYRSLPPRPSIDELEAAVSVVSTVNAEEQKRLEQISKLERPQDVPEELFLILQQARKHIVVFQSCEQKREANRVIDLDKTFQKFDELIQRASGVVSGDDTQIQKRVGLSDPVGDSGRVGIWDVGVGKKMEDGELGELGGVKGLMRSSSAKAAIFSGEGGPEKLSLMKVAAFIENTAKTGKGVLNLQGKLMDQIEWLPVSIGKLTGVNELNLSENSLTVLPPTIGSLTALTKLDLHSNQLMNLPESFGDLVNLVDLDLHANQLSSLPPSFKSLTNLVDLDLSSNQFTQLPETVGNLVSLKRLKVETNELEEIPYTIGACLSLVELVLDFNRLKALPEAIGKLESLEVLTLHYNRIKGLPTTMGNLSNLKKLDVSFNELENVTENLCFAVRLEKLNVGKNFADLTALPRSIGNLENLEELDISDTQIRVLPSSFGLLSRLRVFCADETPLEVPPKHIVNLGAQAVVQYMADLVTSNESKPQISQKESRGIWSWICSIFCARSRSTT